MIRLPIPFARRHPDPHIQMGREIERAEEQCRLLTAEELAEVRRYVAPRRDMPMALMAKTCRDAASAIVRADDPARARAEFLDAMAGTLDRAISDAGANLGEIARRAGL